MSEILQYEFSSLANLNTDSVGTFDTTVATGTAAVSDTGSAEAYGNTAHFDGSTVFEMSTVPTTLTNNSPRSCSTWIYSTVDGSEQRILSTNSGTGITIFQKRSDNKLTVQNSVFGTFSTSDIPLNTWTHCAFTYNGSNTVKVYFEGNLEGTNTWAMNLSTQDMKYIGSTGTGSTFFNGNMLDMRIYDVELDATEISTLFSNGPDHVGVLFPEPILWYKLNEESANIGTDDSGNTTNMTNVNVVSITDTSLSNYGQVADFSGGTLTLPSVNVPSAIIGSSSRTYSFWLESNVVANTQIIDIGTRNLTGRDWGVAVNGSQKIGITLFNTPGIQSSTVMTAGVWYYVVITFEDLGNLLSIYVNSTLEVQESKTVNTGGGTPLEFGEDALAFQDMRLLDMRIYDVAIGQTQISTMYAAGPDIVAISTGLDATVYTHITDLTWDSISGASEYTIRQIKDGSDEEDVLKTAELLGTVNIDNSSTYVFNLYSDLDLVTAAASVNVTPETISTINIGSLLTRISNDLSILSESAIVEIEDLIQDSLSTGDTVILPSGDSSTFVENLDTHVLDELNILTPFTTASAGTITVTHPGETSSTVYVYDETTNEVNGSAIGSRFVSGNYVARLKEISD